MNFYPPYNGIGNQYGNRYGTIQPQQTVSQTVAQVPQFFTPQTNVQYANFEEASAYLIPPNSQMLFLDNNKQKCYLKTCDINGHSTLQVYNREEQEMKEENKQQIDLSAYVKTDDLNDFITKEDLDNFRNEFTSKLNEISRKVEVKNALDTINNKTL